MYIYVHTYIYIYIYTYVTYIDILSYILGGPYITMDILRSGISPIQNLQPSEDGTIPALEYHL